MSHVRLRTGPRTKEFPRELALYGCDANGTWSSLDYDYDSVAFVASIERNPKDPYLTLLLTPKILTGISIELTGGVPNTIWSLSEIEIVETRL